MERAANSGQDHVLSFWSASHRIDACQRVLQFWTSNQIRNHLIASQVVNIGLQAAQRAVNPDNNASQANVRAPRRSESRDQVSLSREASESRPNPYAGVSDGSTTIRVDAWRNGRNDSVEAILRNQGYSLGEIYQRGENGQTLIDRVAQANNLRNPNLLAEGQSLRIPSRANTESVSSRDLPPGESAVAGVINSKSGVNTESAMTRGSDGSSALEINHVNPHNPNAGTSTRTEVGTGGRIDSTNRTLESTEETAGAEITTLAQNRNGSSITEERSFVSRNGTSTQWTDRDGNGNLIVRRTENGVSIVNPDSSGQPGVVVNVDFSEARRDGHAESIARRWFGNPSSIEGAEEMSGFRSVRQSTDAQGRTVITGIDRNGEEQVIASAAGDSDDSTLERDAQTYDRLMDWAQDWRPGAQS